MTKTLSVNKGKLDPHRTFLIELIDQDGDMAMPELAGALADATGVQGIFAIMRRTGISKPTVWRWQER